MILSFEQSASLGPGENPSVVHMPDNSIWLFGLENGRMKAKTWTAETGDVPWDNPNFGDAMIATADKEMDYLRIKNVPRVGVFGAWHQDEVTNGGKTVTPARQRFAIWDAMNDITNFLDSGSVQMDLDNIVSQASFAFKNPFNRISGESESRLTPGNKIELFFASGDSDEYPMGVFYVDRTAMETGSGAASAECRNISGKLLKDQTINGQYEYPKDVYAYVVEDFLVKAGVTDHDVQQPTDPLTAWQLGMVFPPEMDRLTALNEMIKASLNWVIRETLDGQIIAGSEVSYPPITGMYGRYEFKREDLVSHKVERDDADVYSTVCYQSKDTTNDTMIRKFVAVEHALEWTVMPHKTLYITATDDTPETELQEHAENLAERMGYVGVMETFSGPFRPHIIPGDEAEITSAGRPSLLGIITSVTHRFGQDGFFTDFTVDSGGVKGKPQLKDLINKASEKPSDSVKRII